MTEGSAASGSAASEIEALRASADAPDARAVQIAGLLSSLSTTLTVNHHLADATAAEQAAVDILKAHTPNPEEIAAYRFALADSERELAVALWAEQRDSDALPVARAAVTDFRQAAGVADARAVQIAGLLSSLSTTLTVNHHLADATAAE
ncbi:hypothetical protein, partial [Streptomyces mirabilis]|uniref:hypothetical protein n=1 Tax=Streptomyces mirabilis TaxID=68239 RepID=UPI003690D6F1